MVHQIDGLVRFTSALGVKVQSPRGEATHLENDQHDLSGHVYVRGELIGIPTNQGVTGIRINAFPRHPHLRLRSGRAQRYGLPRLHDSFRCSV